MTTGDRLRWLKLQRRKAAHAVERLGVELDSIRRGVRAALAKPGRFDPSWAEAREVCLVRDLEAARAKLARLNAELKP